jgi:flagellar biosynthesis/type III secretory pathway protein FliH
MHDAFRPFSEILRRSEFAPVIAEPTAVVAVEAVHPQHLVAAWQETQDSADASVEAIGALSAGIALARLAAREAYERGVGRVLEALARDVLARELATAPADINRLAAEAWQRFIAEAPVALLVAPEDAPRIAQDVPVRADPSLAAGDVVLVVRDGVVDQRVEVRIRAVLDAVAP